MKFFTFLALLGLSFVLSAQSASYFINEISYTASNPSEKGIEIAGLGGSQMNGWKAVQYDTDGWQHTIDDLSNQIIPNQQNGYGTVWYDIDQAGDGGGIALIDANGVVQQFLAYGAIGGTDLLGGALDGAAAGIIPEYVGLVNSPYATLQLVGLGSLYPTFTWATSQAPSPGQVNTNQAFMSNSLGLQTSGNNQSTTIEAVAYPNPTTDFFRVNLPENETGSQRNLSLFDQQGRLLIIQSVSDDMQTVQVDVSNLPAGFYYLSVHSEDNNWQSEVVIN